MIRQALPGDAPLLSPLVILAMGDLAAKFTNGSDPAKAVLLFEKFIALPANQYSYENILVYEDESGICGMIIGYDGADLELLRTPFLKHIRSVYGFNTQPENETQSGEYYIDCLSVAPDRQGKGIGKQLIQALCNKAAATGYKAIGLLVSKENDGAKKLYTGLGFSIMQEKELLGGNYYHMQYIIKSGLPIHL